MSSRGPARLVRDEKRVAATAFTLGCSWMRPAERAALWVREGEARSLGRSQPVSPQIVWFSMVVTERLDSQRS
jgi:hypothetical protein